MNIYSFPAIVAFVVNFTVAFAVFFGNTRSSANRWISAFILGLAVWNLSEIFILASGNQQGATFAAQILYRAIFLIPAVYVVAAYHFPQVESSSIHGAIFYFVVFLVPVIFLLSSFPHFHIRLVSLSDSGAVYYYRIVIRPDFQSVSLLSTFFVYLCWGSIVMIRKIPTLRTITQKQRARLFLFGGAVFLVSFLAMFGVEKFAEKAVMFYTGSTLLSIVVSGFFAIAVLKGHMFNSPRAMRSSAAYSLASSIMLTIYFLSVQAVTRSLLTYFQISSYAANALFVLGLVLLIRPLELRIYGTLNQLLNRDVRRYHHGMVAFTREISNYLSAGELFHRVVDFLSRQFQIQNAIVLIRNGKWFDESIVPMSTENIQRADSLRVKDDCYLVQRLRETKKAVEFYDIHRQCDPTIRLQLESKNIRVLVPLFVEGDLLGVLAIGTKRSGRGFTAEMIDALTIFANEVATAYHRNTTVEKMRERERQEFRTQHLASLAQLTAGVAHEIRNPLGIISTSAQTLLKMKLSAKEDQKLKQFIVIEADRLNKILTDFLNLSKRRAPKYELVSVEELLERLQTALAPSANGIEITLSLADRGAEVRTDRELLYQLLLNLAVNAVDAIKQRCKLDHQFTFAQGRVDICATVQEEQLDVSVTDNGIGIPEDHLSKIFEPFFTTKETGTGLGLSISHNIAETLGGRLLVSSRNGETTFTFKYETIEAQG